MKRNRLNNADNPLPQKFRGEGSNQIVSQSGGGLGRIAFDKNLEGSLGEVSRLLKTDFAKKIKEITKNKILR